MLPFLLQISLALFFVGLCFFTADIDPTIGNTTLPLVCAWAFLFIAVTVSPIFSAKCPYKTPAVSPVTTPLRCHVGPTLAHWGRVSARFPLLLLVFCFWAIVFTITLGIKIIFARRNRLGDALLSRAGDVILRTTTVSFKPPRRIPMEEADVRIRESEDMEILITADAIQANTEPDLITLEAALKQTNPSREESVVFLLQIIGNRVPLSTDLTLAHVQLPITMIDCSSLSTRTRENIVDLLQRFVISHLPHASELVVSEVQAHGIKISVNETDPSGTWKSILLVWAMTIHISCSHKCALPEKLLVAIDCAITNLNRLKYGSGARAASEDHDSHQVALATCYRITHDNIRASLSDKIRSAADVFSSYSIAVKNAYISEFNSASPLPVAFEDAARSLVKSLEQDIVDTGHALSETIFAQAITIPECNEVESSQYDVLHLRRL